MPIKKTKLTNAMLHVVMSDGSTWAIDVWQIAYHRAKYYMKEFDGDVIRSLNEDTLPLFENDPEYEVIDWVENNMDWKDMEAVLVGGPRVVNYQKEWINGDKAIIYE